MIQDSKEIMDQMYYEDVEFFYKFLKMYANKKGITAKVAGADGP